MSDDEYCFEDEINLLVDKLPINNMCFMFVRCITAIKRYKNIVECHTDELKEKILHDHGALCFDDILYLGELIFNTTSMWNSFGSLLLPIKGILNHPGLKITDIYSKIMKVFDNHKPELIDDIDDTLKARKSPIEHKLSTCRSDFMYTVSKLDEYTQKLSIIRSKNSEDLSDIWACFKMFCEEPFYNVYKDCKMEKANVDEIDYNTEEIKRYLSDIFELFFSFEESECLKDIQTFPFMIAFTNAYLYSSYASLKDRIKELYSDIDKRKKENINNFLN